MTSTVAPRTRTALVAAAVVVTLVVTSVILLFGVIPLPEFPSLHDQPDPSIIGTVALLTTEDTHGSYCLEVAAASGASPQRELACFDTAEEEWVDRLAWTPDGDVALLMSAYDGPRYEIRDPDTGELLAEGATRDGEPGAEPLPADGATASDIDVRSRDGRVTVTVDVTGDDHLVLDVEGPRRYQLWSARWSPDRRHVLAIDSADRLLVITLDGRGGYLLAEDVRAAAWWIPDVGAGADTWSP